MAILFLKDSHFQNALMKQNEPSLWEQVSVFVLPKDYVRYCLTGHIHMEYSDATSTLLLSPKHMIGLEM